MLSLFIRLILFMSNVNVFPLILGLLLTLSVSAETFDDVVVYIEQMPLKNSRKKVLYSMLFDDRILKSDGRLLSVCESMSNTISVRDFVSTDCHIWKCEKILTDKYGSIEHLVYVEPAVYKVPWPDFPEKYYGKNNSINVGVNIGEDGAVKFSEVVSATDAGLVQPALEAAGRVGVIPAKNRCKSVESRVNITYELDKKWSIGKKIKN